MSLTIQFSKCKGKYYKITTYLNHISQNIINSISFFLRFNNLIIDATSLSLNFIVSICLWVFKKIREKGRSGLVFSKGVSKNMISKYDFKHDNIIFKFQPKNTHKVFLVPNWGIFLSSQNFAIAQIRGSWFQINLVITAHILLVIQKYIFFYIFFIAKIK